MRIHHGRVLAIALALALLMPAYGAAHEDLTIWQDGLELYTEPPMLVSGEPARMTVHLTLLEGHLPVREGRLEMVLEPRDGGEQRAEAAAPASPGIYVLELTPEKAGMHALLFRMGLPDGTREFRIRGMPVFTREAAERLRAQGSEEGHDDHDHDSEIVFSKERQWRMAFSVVPSRAEEISARLNLSATVEAVPGRRVDVVAPARGVLRAVPGQSWLREGQRVRAGEPLAELVPLAGIGDLAQLRADLESADARLRLAQSELARVRGLVGDGVLAERRLIEAEAEEVAARGVRDVLRDRLAGARGDVAGTEGLSLPSPLGGTVVSSPIVPGQVVDAGTRVATVLDARRVWLRIHAPAQDIAALTDPQDLRVRRPGNREWAALGDAVLVYRGQVIEDGALPLIFEIGNPGDLAIGLPLIASLAAGAPESLVTVPETAVLDDDGIDVVVVQIGGETFERRIVRVGARAAGRIAVLDGLEAGERIVVHGAYAVLLAGRDAGGLDHGHAH